LTLLTRAFTALSQFFVIVTFFAVLAGLARAGVTLTPSPSPATFGAPVTLTATVTPSTAAGKVTFYDGAMVLGTSTLSGATATLIVPLNKSGTRSLIARYSGDSNNSAAVSPVFSEAVNSVPAFGFLPTNLSLGFSIQAFAIGDFNGDGRIDVVFVPTGNFVEVALGNGDGTFGTPIQTFPHLTGQFDAVVAGDFNGDGKLDIAIGVSGSNSTAVLLGNGDGTFGPPTTYAAGNGPMVVADFNLDGIPDIVVVNAQTFTVLLGKGDGTFGTPMAYSAGGLPSAVTVGDINGDGKPDLVTVVPTADTLGSLIVVLLGNGDGTFSGPNSYTLYADLGMEDFDSAILLEDFNGDGKLDLAIAPSFGFGAVVCLGNGDGTFGPPVPYSAAGQDEGYGVGIAAVDVNGDRKIDIVTDYELHAFLGSGLGNELQTFYGNGDGTFQPVEILVPPLTHILNKLVAADFNGDGRVDLMTWGFDGNNNYILKLFSGAVIPEIRVSATHSGNLTPGQTGAVFNVVVSNVPGSTATTGTVTVAYELNGVIGFDSITGVGWTCSNSAPICSRSDSLLPGSSYPPITVTADVRPTAQAGLTVNTAIVSGGGSETAEDLDPVNIVPTQGCSFSLTPPSLSIPANARVSSIAVTTSAGCTWSAISNNSWLSVNAGANGSGNGTVNFAIGANPGPSSRIGTLTVAGQTFTVTQTIIFVTEAFAIPILDFNGDGNQDVILYDPVAGGAFAGLSNSSGGFSYFFNFFTPGFDIIRYGTITSNGLSDVIAYNSTTAIGYALLGSGSGTFSSAVSMFWGPGFTKVAAGDLNGDGLTDFVIYRPTDGTSYTAISNGDGTFHYQYTLVNGGYTNVVVADFNGDGRADVFYYRSTEGLAYLGISNGTGGFTFSPVSLSAGYTFVEAGDINGDGKADLLFYSGNSGVTAVGLSTGSGFTFTPYQYSPGFTTVKLFDFNGDGKADLALYNMNTAIGYLGISNGTSAFTFSSMFWGPGFSTVDTLDLNGDGKIDVVIYNTTNAAAYTGISPGNAANPFTYQYSFWGTGKMLATGAAQP
jgi:hypothetical protein